MKRSGPLRRYTPMPKPTSRIRKSNPERKAKRRKSYAAHLRSPYFRALRLQAFERDGFRCTETLLVETGQSMHLGHGAWIHNVRPERCPVRSADGKGLHAHHKTYARFGNENVDDLVTLCTRCHRRRHALQGKRISA